MAGDRVSLPEMDELDLLQARLEAALANGDLGLAETTAARQSQIAEALYSRAPSSPIGDELDRLVVLASRVAASRQALSQRLHAVGVSVGTHRRALDGYRRAIAGVCRART